MSNRVEDDQFSEAKFLIEVFCLKSISCFFDCVKMDQYCHFDRKIQIWAILNHYSKNGNMSLGWFIIMDVYCRD